MLHMSRRFLKETGRKRSDFIRDSLRGIFSGRRWSIWIVWKKASVDRARRYDSAIGSREEKSRRGQWKEGVGKFPRGGTRSWNAKQRGTIKIDDESRVARRFPVPGLVHERCFALTIIPTSRRSIRCIIVNYK